MTYRRYASRRVREQHDLPPLFEQRECRLADQLHVGLVRHATGILPHRAQVGTHVLVAPGFQLDLQPIVAGWRVPAAAHEEEHGL